MKRRTHLSPKQLLLFALALLLFTAIILFCFSRTEDQNEAFQNLSRELFLSEVTGNTLNMHYTIADPGRFGITDYSPCLPCYLPGQATSENAGRRELICRLEKLHPQKLSDENRLTYTLLHNSLCLEDAMEQYPYFSEPLGPHSGMQTQLPILLSEYTFRTVRDIEDYLALLEQSDEYLTSLLTYEQEKAAAGMLMSRESLTRVRLQCDTIVTKEELSENRHFLQVTFSERLLPLLTDHIISEADAEKYTVNHNRLLKTVLLPAYETLSDGLLLLEEACSSETPAGLASFPGGREYYALLLSAEASTSLTVSEVKELLKDQLVTCYTRLRMLREEYPELPRAMEQGTYQFLPFPDEASMLEDINRRCRDSFPPLNEGTAKPEVTIKQVSPSLQEYTAPAFYLTSPFDATDRNIIYINPGKVPSPLELYTTLAHEGQPGHMYQNVYCSQSRMAEDSFPVRRLLWYGGFLEGWALYVEFLSFDYAACCMEEQGRPLEAACIRAEKESRSLQLCLYSLLDLTIHSENASLAQVAKILTHFGIQDSQRQTAIYNYIADNPCNYPKYYVGYLELCRTKALAQECWGSSYSDLGFHRFLLETGPCDYATLQTCIREFPLTHS